MTLFSRDNNRFLDSLIIDTMNYRLTLNESLAYIKQRFGQELSASGFKLRRNKLASNDNLNQWLHDYARVGFVLRHKQILEEVDNINTDTWRDYLIENSKPFESKDKNLINKYRAEIRENNKLLQELSLGSPIVAQIKLQIDKYEQKLRQRSTAHGLDNGKPTILLTNQLAVK